MVAERHGESPPGDDKRRRTPSQSRASRGHFCRYSHTKPVRSSFMNSLRFWYSFWNSWLALLRVASSAEPDSSLESLAEASCHAANFSLNCSSLRPLAGLTRVTESPTNRSSLP